jgi:hypothetical protein
MQYTRLAIVVVFLVALVFWLRQCSAPEDASSQAVLDNLKSQAGAITQTQTGGQPPAATTQTQKPAAGN